MADNFDDFSVQVGIFAARKEISNLLLFKFRYCFDRSKILNAFQFWSMNNERSIEPSLSFSDFVDFHAYSICIFNMKTR